MNPALYDYADGKSSEKPRTKKDRPDWTLLDRVRPNYRLIRAAKNYMDPASPTFGDKEESSLTEGYSGNALDSSDGKKILGRAIDRAFEKVGIGKKICG